MTMKNHSRTCLILSAAIVAIALIMTLCGAGINLGTDFASSLSITYNMNEAFEREDVQAVLEAQGITASSIIASGESGETLQILLPEQASEEQIQSIKGALETALLEKYPNMDVETGKAAHVAPAAGAAPLYSALIGVLVADLLILLFLAFRFDLSSGLAAAFGLLHDVLITVSFMVLLRSVIQVNASFIAALLAVIGFSISSTLILFDRIRGNMKKPANKGLSREEVVNISAKESLGRIAIATALLLGILVVLYIVGVDGIRQFSLPVIIGILSGAYSASMINGYVWAFLEDRRHERKKTKRKGKKA